MPEIHVNVAVLTAPLILNVVIGDRLLQGRARFQAEIRRLRRKIMARMPGAGKVVGVVELASDAEDSRVIEQDMKRLLAVARVGHEFRYQVHTVELPLFDDDLDPLLRREPRDVLEVNSDGVARSLR